MSTTAPDSFEAVHTADDERPRRSHDWRDRAGAPSSYAPQDVEPERDQRGSGGELEHARDHRRPRDSDASQRNARDEQNRRVPESPRAGD